MTPDVDYLESRLATVARRTTDLESGLANLRRVLEDHLSDVHDNDRDGMPDMDVENLKDQVSQLQYRVSYLEDKTGYRWSRDRYEPVKPHSTDAGTAQAASGDEADLEEARRALATLAVEFGWMKHGSIEGTGLWYLVMATIPQVRDLKGEHYQATRRLELALEQVQQMEVALDSEDPQSDEGPYDGRLHSRIRRLCDRLVDRADQAASPSSYDGAMQALKRLCIAHRWPWYDDQSLTERVDAVQQGVLELVRGYNDTRNRVVQLVRAFNKDMGWSGPNNETSDGLVEIALDNARRAIKAAKQEQRGERREAFTCGDIVRVMSCGGCALGGEPGDDKESTWGANCVHPILGRAVHVAFVERYGAIGTVIVDGKRYALGVGEVEWV